MVVAFLRAEINSSRHDKLVAERLALSGFTRRLIDEPNLADAAENCARMQVLDCRGYKRREALFAGFPLDAAWRRVVLAPPDFETLRYARYKTWMDLSDGTRLVSVGARNFRQRPGGPETYQIKGIAEALRSGVRFPELIAAQGGDGSLILIEGHSRATAYVLEGFVGEVEILVGTSPSMPRWAFY